MIRPIGPSRKPNAKPPQPLRPLLDITIAAAMPNSTQTIRRISTRPPPGSYPTTLSTNSLREQLRLLHFKFVRGDDPLIAKLGELGQFVGNGNGSGGQLLRRLLLHQSQVREIWRFNSLPKGSSDLNLVLLAASVILHGVALALGSLG